MAQAGLRVRQAMMTMISTENFHQASDKRGQGAPHLRLFSYNLPISLMSTESGIKLK